MSYILGRTGKRPLEFSGKALVSKTSHEDNGPCNTRWWCLDVYKTTAGKLVLALEWNTNWQGEDSYEEATVFDTADELADYLEGFDPLSKLVGFPASRDQKYADRQRHIEQAIKLKWGNMVKQTLVNLDVTDQVP